MELTRYWRAQHDGTDIEVQWTGFRFHTSPTAHNLGMLWLFP